MRTRLRSLLFVMLAAALSCKGSACRSEKRADIAPESAWLGPDPSAVTLDVGDIESLSIDYEHAGWDSVKRSVTIERRGGSYQAGGAAVDAAAMQALAGSLVALVPVDGPKHCNNHTDDYPHYLIRMRGTKGRVELQSSSNCRDAAPWNVVSGGRLYAQPSGQIGAALGPVIQAADKEMALRVRVERWPVFDWLAHGKPPPGVQVAEPFAEVLKRHAAASPVLKSAFPGMPLIAAGGWCYAEGNPTCRKLKGDVTVGLDDRFAVKTEAEIVDLDVKSLAPVPPGAAQKLAASKVWQAMLAITSKRPLVLYFYREDDCAQNKRSAEDLGLPRPTECRAWLTASNTTDGAWMRLSYLPALDVVWLGATGADLERRFLQAVGAGPDAIAKAGGPGRRYARLDGTLVEPK
jgi:hypothetical protein